MPGEENTSAEHGLLGNINDMRTRFETDPDFSRRTFLKGMGAISILTTVQGVGALTKLRSREQLAITAGDICPDHEILCHLKADNIDVPAVQQAAEAAVTEAVAPVSETIVPPTTVPPTTAPPPTPTTAPPPPPPPPAVAEAMIASVEELPKPSRRDMPYQEFVSNAERFYAVLPSLDTLHQLFPGTAFYHFIPEQRQHIENLRQAVQPTPERYAAFAFNTEFSHIFNQTEPLNPQAFVWHWTGWDFASPGDLTRMSPNSVQTYVHKDAVAYQMVPNLDVVAGHARAMNPFCWGMEMYSGHYDEVHSPLFNFTPDMTETGIYVGVNRLRSRKLPINRLTWLSHATADLVFMNPYYDPYSGTFHEIPDHRPITIHKFDPPQEFMDMTLPKAIELDAALGPR